MDDDKIKMDFPSNSHASKSEQPKKEVKKEEVKKVEKVISGRVVQRKKGFFKKMTETFLGDDIKNVGSYIVYDVLIPAAKDTIEDLVKGGIEVLLRGESRGSRTRRDHGKSYVSYNSYYKSDKDERRERREPSDRNRSRHDFDDIILDTRGEAEDVLSHLVDLIEDYGMASVADLYDLVGITGSFTDNKYGWTNLSNATVSRVRDGYLIDLPRTIPLD